MRRLLIGLVALSCGSAAKAYDLAKSKNQPASAAFQSAKSIYDIERCLIEIDWEGAPIVYRAPDRPHESLIYRATGSGASVVIELKQLSGGSTITVKNRSTAEMQKRVEACR